MKKKISILFLFVFILTIPACMTVNLAVEGIDKPVNMTSVTNKKYTIVKHFNREAKGWFTLFNLITIKDVNFDELIRKEINSVQGDAVINLQIKGQTTLVDGAIPTVLGLVGSAALPPAGGILGYLVGARTYFIEGDVIKYTE
jgi:hypothetical protein